MLMAVYQKDQPKQLIQSVESMLHQKSLPEQIVIVEDGPVPESLEKLLCDYERRMGQMFTILRCPQSGGLGSALNQGMKVCRNELIARMDADDISKPDRCRCQLEAFASDAELSIVGTQIDEFVGDISNVVSRRVVPCTNEEIHKFMHRRSPFNHPTVMYKKSAVLGVGGYMTYRRKEDLDLFFRMLHAGCKAKNLPDSHLWYRTSDEHMMRRKSWRNCKEYVEIMYGFYRKRWISFWDMAYVLCGQLTMYLLPRPLLAVVSKTLLRKGKKNG